MDMEISTKAVELIKKDFNGNVFFTYRQYTFNCMCSGGPGEFIKFDKEPYSDHKYNLHEVNGVFVHFDGHLKPTKGVTINVNEKNELVVSGFDLFDKTKVYNLS